MAGPGSPIDPVDYRALVCVTTCQRLRYLRRYLPHFARFCADDPRFSLLVSLDGDEADTRRFCEEWEVPLLYSDQREGVGISKNRVLERFPDFDYYFFLEDDVELVDGRVFPAHVELSQASGIHHFTLFERGGVRKVTAQSTAAGHRIVHGLYGGADLQLLHRRRPETGWRMASAVRRVPPLGPHGAQLSLRSGRAGAGAVQRGRGSGRCLHLALAAGGDAGGWRGDRRRSDRHAGARAHGRRS